jgi:CHASE2 domain-containing sensor protein
MPTLFKRLNRMDTRNPQHWVALVGNISIALVYILLICAFGVAQGWLAKTLIAVAALFFLLVVLAGWYCFNHRPQGMRSYREYHEDARRSSGE